jgi:hypothetical protein
MTVSGHPITRPNAVGGEAWAEPNLSGAGDYSGSGRPAFGRCGRGLRADERAAMLLDTTANRQGENGWWLRRC